MLILPTEKAFEREKRNGIIDSLKNQSEKGIKVRVLVPVKEDEISEKGILDLKAHGVLINPLSAKPPQQAEEGDTRVKIVIVDNRTSLAIELSNDQKENFAEAIGSAILSTGKATVSFHARIFESLWYETRLVNKLRASDKLQREFINIAAHELRTAIQPILGMSELITSQFDDKGTARVTKAELELIVRNARRLERLASDILDTAKIESQSLHLDKREFSLK